MQRPGRSREALAERDGFYGFLAGLSRRLIGQATATERDG